MWMLRIELGSYGRAVSALRGLERWLGGSEHSLFLQRPGVQVPASRLDGSQLPEALAIEDPSLCHGYLHAYAQK